MDNLTCTNNKSPPTLRKVKKKQGKDEMDRLKQAEKKKRRLEKALATSAAIRSELEKKKQKKKEEQQRLDDEGAAIAEAVALHVLLGEDNDDKFEGSTAWKDHADFLMCEGGPKCSLESIGWLSNTHASVLRLSGGFGGGDFTDLPCPSGAYGSYVEEGCSWSRTELCPGLIAAQAVSSLQIRDDANLNTIFVNGMLREGSWDA